MNQELDTLAAEEVWERLSVKARVGLKATDHGMAHDYTDEEGALTPAGEGMAWWLSTPQFEGIDHDLMVVWLAADLEETLPELPPDDEGIVIMEASNRAKVILAARERLEGEVDEDAGHDEGQDED